MSDKASVHFQTFVSELDEVGIAESAVSQRYAFIIVVEVCVGHLGVVGSRQCRLAVEIR